LWVEKALHIQHLVQNSQSLPSAIAPQALAELVAGQRIDAVVVKAALAAQLASIKVADSLLHVTTPVALQQGQTVQLELIQTNGRQVLSLVSAESAKATQTSAVTVQPLAQGQKYLAQVIKVLNDSRIVIELKSMPANEQLAQGQVRNSAAVTTQQIDVDIAKLAKQFTVGEKLLVDVINSKPLAIELRAPTQSREQVVIAKLKQLLQQQTPTTKQNVTGLTKTIQTSFIPQAVRNEVSHLINNVLDKRSVNRPQLLQQALQQSGLFTEKQLLKQPALLNKDFKANVLKVLARIEGELTKNAKEVLAISNKPIVPLSKELALGQLAGKPASQAIDKPTQSLSVSTQSIINKLKNGNTSQDSVKPQNIQLPKKTSIETTRQQNNTRIEATNSKAEPSAVKPLSSLILASAFHRINSSSATVLSSPPLTSSFSALMPLSNIAISTPAQAMGLAKLIAHAMASEKVRGLQVEFVVLQNLLKEVESLHTRLQLTQFSMLKEAEPSPNMPTASWLLDLPIKDQQDIHFVQLQIDQHKDENDEESNDIWNVQLRLDTQNLGPLQATVTLHNNDIKVVLRAERATSAELLQQNLSNLESALEKLGVSLSHISCVCGEVAKPTLVQQYLSESDSLVDILI